MCYGCYSPPPSPLFLGGFLNELSRIFSSDYLIISIWLFILPFVESGTCLSWCWISFCLLYILLAGSFSAGILSSSVLLSAIALTVAFAVAQLGAFTNVDGAGQQTQHGPSLLQKVTAFILWPATHFQPQPWVDMVIPAPEKSGWFWSPHTWFMWLWAHPKWAVKAWPSWFTARLAPYGKWMGLLPSRITVGSLLSLQEPLPSWSTEISFSCVEEWLL